MAQTQTQLYISPEEYLALERQAEYKSEYWNGEMFAMAGASEAHNIIISNAVFLLVGQLRGRNCKTYSNDMRVRISESGLYTYPDIVIVCGNAEFDDKHKDTLLNPTVLIEVLSSSTEAYDRGDKFEHYRALKSLSDYVLISQHTAKIEHFVRQNDEQWVLSERRGREVSLEIATISCILALSEVYDKVDFPDEGSGMKFIRSVR